MTWVVAVVTPVPRRVGCPKVLFKRVVYFRFLIDFECTRF